MKKAFAKLVQQFIMNGNQIVDFDNEEWDFMNPQERDRQIFGLFKKQFIFSKEHVPFYSQLYKNISENDLNSLQDCIEKIPKLQKTDIRNLSSPYDLLPINLQNNLHKIHFHRGTGGTTGEPTSMFFTQNDWQAVLGGMTRALKELKELNKPIKAFNGYNQGHISGPIFDDTIRKIGGLSIARNFGNSDEQALKQLAKHKCNLIIAPPVSTHKGGSVEHLLEIDAKTGANYINGDNIDVLFCSSTKLTQELYKEIKSLGIKYVYNYYGSTEILPTAISCQHSPFDLHILFGHIALFVADSGQKLVKNGERGIVLSSKIGSYDNNKISENQGTQLLNYQVGDEVTLITEKCECGRTSPRIKDIQRVQHVQNKLETGCEAW